MSIGLAGLAAVTLACGSVVGSGINIPVCAPDSARGRAYGDGTAYTYYISRDADADDLINQRLITEDDMNYLVDHYVSIHPDSAFKGCGWAFIEASNETKMDPLFFFSLAGIESGWGTSSHHEALNNPYSMGMYGDGVHNGYSVGDSFADGVIEGAKYIYEHYYLNGQTTLYKMNHHGDHSFCAGDPDWEYQIASEMAYCSYLIDNR